MTETATGTPPELHVPDEPGVYWCARHKNVKTRLRCGRCETPICPKCTVMGPTGARCRNCASNRSSHMYQVAPWQFATTFLASVAMCVVGALLTRAFGLFLLFYAPVIGTFLGKAIIAITRGKRGVPLCSVATAGAVVGTLLAMQMQGIFHQVQYALHPPPGLEDAEGLLTSAITAGLYPLVFAALAISAIWYWLR